MTHHIPDCNICRMKQSCVIPAMFEIDKKLLSTTDPGEIARLWQEKAKLIMKQEKKMLYQIPADKLEPMNGEGCGK